MKYKRKYAEVEAIQYGYAEWADNPFQFHTPFEDWIKDEVRAGNINPEFRTEDCWYLALSNGDLVGPGDWVVKLDKGLLFKLSNEEFMNQYEFVRGDSNDSCKKETSRS